MGCVIREMIIDYKQLTGLKRIPLDEFGIKDFKKIGHKPYMTSNEVCELLSGIFYVSEKVDGKTGFDFYHMDVAYRDDEGVNMVIFYENTLERHSIDYKQKYKKLAFDIAQCLPDGQLKIIHCWDRTDILDEQFPKYNFIFHKGYRGTIQEVDYWIRFLNALSTTGSSKYGAPKKEGLVIKNYEKGLFGKIVNPEFEDSIEENYIRRGRNKK